MRYMTVAADLFARIDQKNALVITTLTTHNLGKASCVQQTQTQPLPLPTLLMLQQALMAVSPLAHCSKYNDLLSMHIMFLSIQCAGYDAAVVLQVLIVPAVI